jgi:hypothetical protein
MERGSHITDRSISQQSLDGWPRGLMLEWEFLERDFKFTQRKQ